MPHPIVLSAASALPFTPSPRGSSAWCEAIEPLIDAERPTAMLDGYLRAAVQDRAHAVQDLHARLQTARVLRIERSLGVDSGAMLVEVETDLILSQSAPPLGHSSSRGS